MMKVWSFSAIAASSNKPNGVTIVPASMIQLFLQRVQLSDVCGIGKNRLARLNKFNIQTPMDYVNSKEHVIKRLLGKTGTELWHEMQGKSVIGLALHPQLAKSISRTASMGNVTSSRQVIISHLTRHSFRLAIELVSKKLLTKRITIFLTMKDFNTVSAKTDFDYPTNNYFRLSHPVQKMITELYQAGELYRACGITAEKISKAEETQPDLFGVMKRDAKEADLLLTVDKINRRYGHGAVKMAGALSEPKSAGNVKFMYLVIVAV